MNEEAWHNYLFWGLLTWDFSLSVLHFKWSFVWRCWPLTTNDCITLVITNHVNAFSLVVYQNLTWILHSWLRCGSILENRSWCDFYLIDWVLYVFLLSDYFFVKKFIFLSVFLKYNDWIFISLIVIVFCFQV